MFKKILITSICLSSIVALSASVYAQQQNLDEILGDILGEEENQAEEKETITKDKTIGEVHGTAADILEKLDDGQWTYIDDKDAIAEVIKAEDTMVTLHTTKALYKEKAVLTYQVFFSESMLSSQKFSDIESKIVTGKDMGDKVELVLDGLKANTTYYAVIAPSNPEDEANEPLDKITGEIRFKTSDTKANNNTVEDTKNNDTNNKDPEVVVENKPVVKATMNSVSYTTNNNNIELKWIAKNTDMHNIEISIRHTNDLSFSPIGNIKADTQVFSFSVDKAGAYLVKLKMMDENGKQIGADKNLNLNIKEFKEDITPTVTNPPKVGPTTDILIALALFAAMIYIVYRVRRVENK